MRYAIISDVHSNLEAFNAVLSEIDSLKGEAIVCLGDVVGYNANPNECVEIIRKRNIPCVMGNHDARAAGLEEPWDFNPAAAEAILWTREKLTEENKEFLRGLPRRLRAGLVFIAVHGFIDSTDDYIFSETEAAYNFEIMKKEALAHVAFFGHTHVRIAYTEEQGKIERSLKNPLDIRETTRYLINPGGVGQPRDRNPMASFCVYDTEKNEVTFHRVKYDIALCAEKIVKAGLPAILAERLKTGW